MMKGLNYEERCFAFLLAVMLVCTMFAGCGNAKGGKAMADEIAPYLPTKAI